MILSILICTIEERVEIFKNLLSELEKQNIYDDVEILYYSDNKDISVGKKRNELISRAAGKYVCFVDDDDQVCQDYIKTIRDGCLTNPDCISLIGEITFNGKDPRTFIHSLQYDSYFEKDNVYYRPPNHLNTVKKELIKDITFPEKNCGEDTDWAMAVCNSKILKTEYKVDKTIYYYIFDTEKTATQK